jgi:phosphatidylserine/phosphatidylglycerophosphate/cardiolipin synthase-like enzyme
MISEPKLWSTWKGRIIRAIVLDGNYTAKEILESTRLGKDQFEQALKELFQTGLLMETGKDRFLVNSSELCNEYRSYWKEVKQTLVDWVNEWRKQEKLETALNHFFLEDKLLDKFSENLIENAKLEILVASPYVEQCHISNSLISMSKKGITARLLTRSLAGQQYQHEKKAKYLSKLAREGVSVTYDESIHAKLIVVDKRVAIVSSMNFVAASSGGASWEAGLVTTEENVVQSVLRSIINRTRAASIDQ